MHRARRASDRVRERAERELSRLLPALAAEMPLRRALAFGSFARGDMHELSDLDLLLVGDFQEPPRLRERAVREIAWRLGIETPLDVVAATAAGLEAGRERPFLDAILAETVELALPRRDGGPAAPGDEPHI